MSFNAFASGAGVNANDIVATLADTYGVRTFAVFSNGTVYVEVSLDGTTFTVGSVAANAIALNDETSLTPATKVGATAAGKVYSFDNRGYQAVRIRQLGASAVTGTISGHT